MKRKLWLPISFIFLAALIGLPVKRYDYVHAAWITQPHNNTGNVTAGPPDETSVNHSQSQRSNQTAGSSSKPNLYFDRLTAADGMSFSLSLKILQDQQGFMWFGTRYGLNKYDGSNFTVYNIAPDDPDPSFSNAVQSLFQDHKGDLWVGTLKALARWDRESMSFVQYKYGGATTESLGNWAVNAIGESSTGDLWVGTSNGLYRYEPATDRFTGFLKRQAVTEIYSDRQGSLWVGSSNGLWHADAESLAQEQPVFERYKFGDEYVSAIQEDRQGALWVGTANSGIKRLNLATGQITTIKHNPDDPDSLGSDAVYSILLDASDRLWVGTNIGLDLFNPATGGFFHYHHDPDDPHSLSSDLVFDLYQDRSGVLWIATRNGISKLNENAGRFDLYQHQTSRPGKPTGLSDSMIEAVLEDHQNILWIGTTIGGLNRLDRSSGDLTVYTHDPLNPSSLSNNDVGAIYEDKAGKLWIGTGGGLDVFDPQSETFDHVGVLGDHVVSAISEDQEGNLWVGYWGGILRRDYDGKIYKFSSPSPIGDMLWMNRVNKIYPDHTGAIWISTQDNGLFRIDPSVESDTQPTVVHFPKDADDPKSPGMGYLMSFYEDAQGSLWMGSILDGLIRFDRETQTFTHYLPDTGAIKYVSCIQGDAQGYLWIGTKLGLARFDPRTEKFLYFDARDGLVGGETLVCYQNEQGEMFFGGLQGLNAFFPDQIRDNLTPPPVVITALNVGNQALRTDLPPDEQITLSYQENYLSFDYAALDYTAPLKNEYAYKMEGLDSEWIAAGTRRHADFPDLKPGSYIFRVKASNNSGVWNEQGASVHITITPPFWQTWWFLGLIGLTLVGGVAGGVRLRLKGLESRSHDLEEQVYERTGALTQKTLELAQRNLEIEQRRHELEALYQADEELLRHFHLDEILQALVDIAVDILHADKGSLLVWDEKKEYLIVHAFHGFNSLTAANLKIKTGKGIAGKVAISGIPQTVEDTALDPDVTHQLTDPEGIRSFMQVPIQVKGETFGVFSADYLYPRRFNEDELRLLVAFAQRAALAIQNAQAHQQEQDVAVLEERSRLARELHDAVTQTLFSASLVAEALPVAWENDPQEGRSLLQELRGLNRGALAEMRTLLLELRPAALLESFLGDLLHQLGEAASGREGIPVSVQVEGRADLPPDVQIAFYRIAQEALNNVVKHARAHQATVRLCFLSEGQPDFNPGSDSEWTPSSGLSVLLSISDDGYGFDPAQSSHNRLGLGIMQERAQAIGAILTIQSQPGHGTQVTVLWKQDNKREAT